MKNTIPTKTILSLGLYGVEYVGLHVNEESCGLYF